VGTTCRYIVLLWRHDSLSWETCWIEIRLSRVMRTLSNMTEKWRVLQYTRPATPDKQFARRVWRYQRGNQNPYIEEQTTQWPKEKVQKDKQRSTKHTYKTKDWVTRTPLKSVGELRCFGRASSSCSTSDNRSVNLVTNPVISHLQAFSFVE
jgi:hypothetical protein